VKNRYAAACLAAAFFCAPGVMHSGSGSRLDGHWNILVNKSANIDPWVGLMIDITTDGNRLTIVKRYNGGHPHDRRVDSISVTPGKTEVVTVPPGRWLGEVSMALYYGPGAQRQVLARVSDPGNEIQVESRDTLETAQGRVPVDVQDTFTLSPDGVTMEWRQTRSTRLSGPPLVYSFARVTR